MKWKLIDTQHRLLGFCNFFISNFDVDKWGRVARNDGWNIFYTYPTYIFDANVRLSRKIADLCIQFYIIYSWEVFFFVCAKLPNTNYLPKKICNLCWIDIWSYVISFGINLLLLIPSRIRNCKISIRNCQYNAGIGNILKYNLWSCISQTFDVLAFVRNTYNQYSLQCTTLRNNMGKIFREYIKDNSIIIILHLKIVLFGHCLVIDRYETAHFMFFNFPSYFLGQFCF